MKTLLAIVLTTLLMVLGLSASTYAADGTPVWTNTYNGPINGDDEARAITLDAGGNVYITGAVFTSRSTYDTDYATIKYSQAGVMLWAKFFNGAGNDSDIAYALAVDANSNVVVTGYSIGSGSGRDYTTIKYSSAGVPLWTNIFNGAGNGYDEADAIAVSKSGDVYVTGITTGTNLYSSDCATIKYSASGVPLRTNIYNGAVNGNDEGSAVKLDQNDNVFVTGSSQIATNLGNDLAYVTIKYSPAGSALWTNYFNGTGSGQDTATALGLDAGGDVYVTGIMPVSGLNNSYATIKYSTDGAAMWTNYFNIASTDYVTAFGLALDGNGNVYVAGGPIFSGSGSQSVNYATVKYSTTGSPLWTNLFVGTAHSDGQTYGIAVDASGNAFVTGDATDSGSGRDFVTIKYSAPPTPLVFVTTNGSFGPINQQFVLKLTGPPGSNAVISAGTNLQTWVALTTNQLSDGTLQFTDKLATNYLLRFYRAKLQ